jgi:predicted nucleotidyltransferase
MLAKQAFRRLQLDRTPSGRRVRAGQICPQEEGAGGSLIADMARAFGPGPLRVWPWRYRNAMYDETVIAEAARRLSAAAPEARVILFGSHARGDAGPGSDLDFLVVEPEVDDPAQESVRLRRTLRGLGLFADVVVVSEHEAQQWRDVRGSLIHSALSEGRPLAA